MKTVEELQADILKMEDEKKEREAVIANLTKERDDLKAAGKSSEDKIKDLQTLNEKLFLRVETGAPASKKEDEQAKKDEPEDLTPDEIVAKCAAEDKK